MKSYVIFAALLTITKARTIIIGAGASGIAAATRLLENNETDILMLEAEHRIGGRIHTIKFGATVQDLGAQWCHGEAGNVVYELAQPLGLLEDSKFMVSNIDFVSTNGRALPRDKLIKILNKAEVEEISVSAPNVTIGGYVTTQINKLMEEQDFMELQDIKGDILKMLEIRELIFDAANSWDDMFIDITDIYETLPGHQKKSWKGRGFRTILDILMKKIPDPSKELPLQDKIHLGKEVVNINWDRPNNAVIVQCEDGSTYEADRVIITTSLGVLKDKYEQLFNPHLPLAKVNAIKGLGFGVVDKIIFEFPYQWWSNNSQGFFFIRSKVNESREITELFLENNWLEGLSGIHPYDYQPNNLLIWCVTNAARTMERLDENYVKNTILRYIRLLFREYTVPDPISFVRTQWDSSPHFRGSYSFNRVMTVTLNTSNAALALPVQNSNNMVVLQFAGEATNPNHYSTVHGAIETGWREADRILKANNSIL